MQSLMVVALDAPWLQTMALTGGRPVRVVLGIGALALVWFLIDRMVGNRRVQRRLRQPAQRGDGRKHAVVDAVDDPLGQERAGRLRGWLASAGYDEPGSGTYFAFACAAAVLGAVLVAFTLDASGLQDTASLWLEQIPGGLADLFIPIMRATPWILAIIGALIPVVWVRRRRRKRQEQVQRDLPYVLGLLATLVESGLGFDAAAMRVERALGADRVLAYELSRVRAATLAGAPRSLAFRQMARRLDVPSLTAFSSALIHAENQGASIGDTLRRQAVDLWARRREEAIQSAQTLPTKLAFPLVICFLPGVFVWTFGPAIAEFLRLAGSSIINRS